MVSLGDTAISLHILQPTLGMGGGHSGSQNSKCQDLPKFQFWGKGGILEVKTQGAKICLNFNFRRGDVLNPIPEQGVVRNLSTNFFLATFWKPLHHR